MFTNDGNNRRDDNYLVLVPGVDVTTSNIMCCKKWGHIYHNFTETDLNEIYSNGATGDNGRGQELHLIQACLIFIQNGKKTIIKDTWMIFYTDSTPSVTKNYWLLTDVFL